MNFRIETLAEKKMIGNKMSMSFTDNKTFALWQGFMPARKEIGNIIGTELFSIEIYPSGYFDNFNPSNAFEKWAAVEVKDFDAVPHEMENLVIPGGLYAVFFTPRTGK